MGSITSNPLFIASKAAIEEVGQELSHVDFRKDYQVSLSTTYLRVGYTIDNRHHIDLVALESGRLEVTIMRVVPPDSSYPPDTRVRPVNTWADFGNFINQGIWARYELNRMQDIELLESAMQEIFM